ncbi:hypothetical protein [Streptomyces sp. NBC_01244]|uniref:hypothetical protein n=1 Tax=Streptomyces sp. NBC_01244 TaxID=2903797 RepID=UPI002E11A792|nr:hypothetical protein OG247_07675 [Streptomyces sp. NBC_01244]
MEREVSLRGGAAQNAAEDEAQPPRSRDRLNPLTEDQVKSTVGNRKLTAPTLLAASLGTFVLVKKKGWL